MSADDVRREHGVDLPDYVTVGFDGELWSLDGQWRWTGAKWVPRYPQSGAAAVLREEAERNAQREADRSARLARTARANRKETAQGLAVLAALLAVVCLAGWGVTSWAGSSAPGGSPEQCAAWSLSAASGDHDSANKYAERC